MLCLVNLSLLIFLITIKSSNKIFEVIKMNWKKKRLKKVKIILLLALKLNINLSQGQFIILLMILIKTLLNWGNITIEIIILMNLKELNHGVHKNDNKNTFQIKFKKIFKIKMQIKKVINSKNLNLTNLKETLQWIITHLKIISQKITNIQIIKRILIKNNLLLIKMDKCFQDFLIVLIVIKN